MAQKLNMMTTFQITNFNAATALVYPHNDYGVDPDRAEPGFPRAARARVPEPREPDPRVDL